MDIKQKLHIAGCIVYEELLSPELKRAAMDMFLRMDSNRDGSVSLQELTACCDSSWDAFVRKMFRLLDVDNSGSLDFDECKALFFLALCNATWGDSAWRVCDSCSASVLDSIYTCSTCLFQRNAYFDLCTNCYPAALGTHVPAHRFQFERHDLKVGSVIDMILTEAARESSPPSYNVYTITYNQYYINNNPMSQDGSRNDRTENNTAITPYQNNTTSRSGLMRTTTRRLTRGVTFVANVAAIVSACSIM